MSTEINPANAQTIIASKIKTALPVLVERAGPAGRFAWDEFFYAEHHNPHTQKALHGGGEAFSELVRGAGGRATGHHAGHGGSIPREPGRL